MVCNLQQLSFHPWTPAAQESALSASLSMSEPGATSDSDAQHVSMDTIFIEGFTGMTVIGIHESELHRPQPVRIDLRAGLPRSGACDTDRIGDTIDYAEVRARLQRLLQEHEVRLLEAFAETIAGILVREFGAFWVRVRVTKPHKFEDVEGVGVEIERRAQDFAPAVPLRERSAAMLSLIGAGMVPGAAQVQTGPPAADAARGPAGKKA